MKIPIAIASALAYAFSLGAQIAAKVDRSPDGYQRISVHNDSKMDLVAFVVRAKQLTRSPEEPSGPSLLFFDALDGDWDALAPGEQRTLNRLPEPAGRHAFDKPIMIAGIFADGSTAGDTELLRLLLSYRSNRLAAIETALDALSEAGQRNLSRDRLIEQFQKMADAARRWYIPEEQRSAAKVYESIVDRLVNLPEQEPGAPFPPTDFVRGEIATLSRERAALLDSEPSLSAELAR